MKINLPNSHDCLKANLAGDVACEACSEGPDSGLVSGYMESREVVDASTRELADPC